MEKGLDRAAEVGMFGVRRIVFGVGCLLDLAPSRSAGSFWLRPEREGTCQVEAFRGGGKAVRNKLSFTVVAAAPAWAGEGRAVRVSGKTSGFVRLAEARIGEKCRVLSGWGGGVGGGAGAGRVKNLGFFGWGGV